MVNLNQRNSIFGRPNLPSKIFSFTAILLLLFSAKAKDKLLLEESICDFEAFVMDKDPKGLSIREKPNAQSKILGKIPPAIVESPDSGGDYLIKPELKVIASKGGWFKIRDVQDNSALIEALAGLKPRPMFSGTGWVSGKLLTIKSQANVGYLEPNIKSKVIVRKSDEITFDNFEGLRLKGCQGRWVYVEDKRLKKNNLYWLNAICGTQETSCDGLGVVELK